MAAVDPHALLRELNAIQALQASRRTPESLARARELVAHPDNDVRWQALIAVGEWIALSPEAVWEVVDEHGAAEDPDMRTAVATVLLEHLLEHDFETYFARVRERIEAGQALLADTLGRCWGFGTAEHRWHEVDALLGRSRTV